MAVKNNEIMDVVVKNMPEEHASLLEGKSSKEAFTIMQDYPSTLNSFINTLTNKVTKSLIYSKIFANPLKFLKKGKLEEGFSIEELFVEMAQVKGFTAHWEESANTPEADLIRKLVPKVTAMYIQLNVDFKLKTTVMDKSLRKAFLNEGGLSNLVGQIVGSITSSAEFKEFNLTKETLSSIVSEGKQIQEVDENGDTVLAPVNSGTNLPIKQTPFIKKIEGVSQTEKMKSLVVAIRKTVGDMKFPTTKYNLAKKLTWTKPDELYLVTTPTVSAELDVNVLASAFHVSSTDINVRTIEIDEMPKGIFKAGSNELVDEKPTVVDGSNVPTLDNTKKPIAILISKDFLQIWDTFQGGGAFHNPDGAYTNHFANREGIFATCLFENLAVFYE